MNFKLDRFRSSLQAHGLQAGLKDLNDPVDHRYTAVYKLSNSIMKNIALHDKQGEIKPEFLEEVPLGDSFCQFVLRDGFFHSQNTGEDRRLDGHKYQGALLSYYGVPVLDNKGELFGTLCHFDALQRTLSDEDFELLQQAAKILPAYLPHSAG